MTAILLFGLFAILVLLQVPIAISLAASSLVVLFLNWGPSSFTLLPDILYASVSKFTLLSIPFFILAGVIMEYAGISKRLINFAYACVGHYKSGMIFVTVLTAIFFAAISGSGPATVAAIGGILIPALVKNGMKKESASALLASSGAIGIVIPPSIAMIVFAIVAGGQLNISIERLFLAGVIPGILLGVGFIVAAIYVRNKDVSVITAKEQENMSTKFGIVAGASDLEKTKDIARAFKDAIWGLLMPVIILGGIYGGVFTPTEAAVVAVFYGFFVGVFIYKDLKLNTIYKILYEAGAQTAVIMLIVSSASLFAYIITTEQIAQSMADSMLALSSNPIVILLLINLILLIAGAFIDAVSAFYIFVPILTPIILSLNVDPTVFGVFMTVNLAIGLFTPPVGVNLYVASGIGRVKLYQISKSTLPFLISAIIVLLLITFIPSISTYLPNLLGVK
ncbi:TRAP transporter large permease [Metabacillus sediminilitoris]|uniref:TRAP transporter large permease n=1 Tax=Metabacillus sediminilitoris TaxID=2567941 RepID=A0A4V6RXI2_9BACI|nr:TRAP transporter large permease [Metabacillus sediminilitoris]QGQ45568.1 TRAP transporter large permease subunit [Metabacillus sediminilitoris]THF76632.1 TRAP transporter large permease [Metabacillus sediminilitoris]